MPKTFYIIDGHAHIYRAYYAPFRDLTSATGEPTRATFVFTQMLLNLIEQRKPEYLAMVIDSGDEQVFRRDFYPEYKANRQSPPDDFRPQEERILRIVRDSGVPLFAKERFEADDLIATMTKRLEGQGFEVFIVSKDKDLRQLLDESTKMYDPATDEVIDVARMQEKCGYSPIEAIEVQTLTGDSIDNVPGIPGVGEKTAAKLVKQFGSADAVLQHLPELTPKLRENFEKYGDRLVMSRKLVTLKNDVDFDFDPETCRFQGLNAPGAPVASGGAGVQSSNESACGCVARKSRPGAKRKRQGRRFSMRICSGRYLPRPRARMESPPARIAVTSWCRPRSNLKPFFRSFAGRSDLLSIRRPMRWAR